MFHQNEEINQEREKHGDLGKQEAQHKGQEESDKRMDTEVMKLQRWYLYHKYREEPGQCYPKDRHSEDPISQVLLPLCHHFNLRIKCPKEDWPRFQVHLAYLNHMMMHLMILFSTPPLDHGVSGKYSFLSREMFCADLFLEV